VAATWERPQAVGLRQPAAACVQIGDGKQDVVELEIGRGP
jgi:hypothetical protein